MRGELQRGSAVALGRLTFDENGQTVEKDVAVLTGAGLAVDAASGQLKFGSVLAVVDLSDAANPQPVSLFLLPSSGSDVVLREKLAIVGSFGSEALLVNLTDPRQPVFAGRITAPILGDCASVPAIPRVSPRGQPTDPDGAGRAARSGRARFQLTLRDAMPQQRKFQLGNIIPGVFTPVLAKVIYRAFVEDELDVPKHLARRVHEQDFNPQVPEFAARSLWSLSNAFTGAFKDLDPIPQFKATACLASFLEVATAGTSPAQSVASAS